MVVATNAPRGGSLAPSSSLSGLSVHNAMAMKLVATVQRNTCGVSQDAAVAPSQPAIAWLSRVATRMPATMGHGLRKRAASSRASSWVLSPISARATVRVETSSGSIRLFYEHGQQGFAIAIELGRADAGDAGEALDVGRRSQRDLAQGAVVEDHVGRHVLRARRFRAPGAQRLEARRRVGGQADGHGCRASGGGLALALPCLGRGFGAQGHAPFALQ